MTKCSILGIRLMNQSLLSYWCLSFIFPTYQRKKEKGDKKEEALYYYRSGTMPSTDSIAS